MSAGHHRARRFVGQNMSFEFLEDATKFVLIVACLYFAVGAYVRRWQPAWSAPLEKRRLAIVWMLGLAVFAVKVGEDAITGDSGPIDKAILAFIHAHVRSSSLSLFEAITLSGSAKVLAPAASIATLVLWNANRRFEALLLATSTIGAAAVVYVVKSVVGRTRPALWETEWYWGSSFPSGHTLVVAAFASAAALCLSRIWPATREAGIVVAFLWIMLVAFSRLVLGVHWPTDVLAAACIGVCLPLAIGLVSEFRKA